MTDPCTEPRSLVAHARVASRAPRGETRRRPRDTDRGPTPTGNEAGTAGSGPTAERSRQETHDRAGGRLARSSGDRRNSDRARGFCTKTGRGGRGRNHHTEIARTRRRASHTAESSGIPARERSRSDRARSGRARSARDTAVRRSSRARPLQTRERAPCQRPIGGIWPESMA